MQMFGFQNQSKNADIGASPGCQVEKFQLIVMRHVTLRSCDDGFFTVHLSVIKHIFNFIISDSVLQSLKFFVIFITLNVFIYYVGLMMIFAAEAASLSCHTKLDSLIDFEASGFCILLWKTTHARKDEQPLNFILFA